MSEWREIVQRNVCTEPITCELCGHLPDQCVEYFDEKGYCSDCAYRCGFIDKEQWLDDEDENMISRRTLLDNRRILLGTL